MTWKKTVLDSLRVDIKFYFRYVDDIIIAAPENKIRFITNKFNNYNDRMKFTLKPMNNSISFLDLNIILEKNRRIIIDWYHKKTFSDRLLSYYSGHLFCHKIGTLYNLLDRAILLSHPKFHNKNINLCINILLENGYPLHMIFHYFNRRIGSLNFYK